LARLLRIRWLLLALVAVSAGCTTNGLPDARGTAVDASRPLDASRPADAGATPDARRLADASHLPDAPLETELS
jgi:hypothetical protein